MTTQPDYFELFGLPRRYALDRKALEDAYERLTLEHHPDFFTTADDAAREEAARISALVNLGYRVLRNDLERAAHLLDLFTGGRELDTTALPEGFLQEMFTLQEEVDALDSAEVETPGDEERREALQREAEERLEAVHAERDALFDAAADGAAGAPDPAALQAIQSNLNCERYLRRLLGRLAGEPMD